MAGIHTEVLREEITRYQLARFGAEIARIARAVDRERRFLCLFCGEIKDRRDLIRHILVECRFHPAAQMFGAIQELQGRIDLLEFEAYQDQEEE